MGEEVQSKSEHAEEKAAVEEKKGEDPNPPPPPPPFVLYVDLHCIGCARKIEKSIMKIRGVEGVAIDMGKNQLTIKGIVEPQAVCNKIMKRTKRRAIVLSPLLPDPDQSEGVAVPQLVTSQVVGPVTVELSVDMHCQACAEQLKRKILKMRGVLTATTDHSTGKVTVTGSMDANKLVDYVYRRTKKQARIVPQSPPPELEAPPPEPEAPPQPEPESKEEAGKKEAEGEGKPAAEEAKKEEPNEEKKEEKEEGEKEAGEHQEGEDGGNDKSEEESMKKMIYYYQPLYVIERMPPPPQLFSDENPNACCIL